MTDLGTQPSSQNWPYEEKVMGWVARSMDAGLLVLHRRTAGLAR